MNFNAENSTIKGLLSNPRSYQIPRFQRDFSWDKSNYNEFLTDMLGQIKVDNDVFHTSQYYLGNMLFLGENNSKFVEVIDGQQRLTTITILLAAIRNKLFDTKDEQAKEYANTIQNEYLVKKIDGQPQRKIQTYSSYPYFTQTIQDYYTKNNNVVPSTFEEELLKETFNYFIEQLEKEKIIRLFNRINKQNIPNESYINLLISLRDQILESEVINIFSSDKEHVNRIYQNINSKGKPLSQIDLIKNDIFSKIGKTDAGVDEISDDWKEILETLSKLDISMNEFFFHFWKASYPKDRVTSTNLYLKYMNKFGNSTENELKKFIEFLKKSLDIYSNIIKPDPNAYKKQQYKLKEELLNALTKFHGVQIRIVLLALYNSPLYSKVKNKKELDFLTSITDFHFIAFGSSLTIRTNKLSTPYNDFVKKVYYATKVEELNTAMNELVNKLFSLVNENDFIESFKQLSFSKKENTPYNYSSQYVIKRIANILDNREYSPNDWSIEHIIDEDKGDFAKNIGNLIVLETKINNELNKFKQKNGSIEYSDKKKQYNSSSYTMVKDLIKDHESFSKESEILCRAEQLAVYFWKNFNKN
ncbi:DUF262 domain-containing protein [Actinobacillus equuli]|uniref:DUF262 domain-containing protein n=1 Tax=Actinobacillus equuli TaxID=718 RepID=UPI002418820C|nr:DUF262 domain-containing protein [Actinobacillus equuli]MDG4953094.1 DUF262 domain-containing protein [Actinobacillus equuli subsp. equuli]